MAYLPGGGVVRQQGGVPLLCLRIGIEELLVGDGVRFELSPLVRSQGLLETQPYILDEPVPDYPSSRRHGPACVRVTTNRPVSTSPDAPAKATGWLRGALR